MLRRGSLPAVPWWVPASVPVPVVFELATESAEEGMGDFYRDRKGLKAAAAPSPAAAAQAPGGGEDRDLSPAASGAGGGTSQRAAKSTRQQKTLVLRDVSVSVAVAAEMCCGYQVTLEWSEFSMEASSTVCSKSVSARKAGKRASEITYAGSAEEYSAAGSASWSLWRQALGSSLAPRVPHLKAPERYCSL
ncbi:uncharacterized protein LOC128917536 isoform X7 [Rissa tridactyla]|uniref:uncharacterized protein LOC128917536 isoform X7 n=1 Tax=Rissa tridactyla TaxID=75485 RepID=UPI0023BA7CAC|nr:uncharacterized protein LOC128917536 isoform X7 [Rissa tridactyla]